MIRVFLICGGLIVNMVTTNRLYAQTQDAIAAINHHVKFVNESFHGMLVIHRLLENFNQEVNKYVDLQSSQINFYGNADLPANVFQDSTHWFYDPTPYEWYQKCQQSSPDIPAELRHTLSSSRRQLKLIIDSLNELRFEIEKTIQTSKLQQMSAQKYIYAQLETGVRWYAEAFELRKTIQNKLEIWSKKHPEAVAKEWNNLHHTVQSLLEHVRFNRLGEAAKLRSVLSSWQPGSKLSRNTVSPVRESVSQLIKYSGQYLDQQPIDPFYILYGDYYYYYNVELLNRYNRYGNGLVSTINTALESQTGKVLWLEDPPLFKVIYPAKAEINPYRASKEKVIQNAPQQLNDRKIINQQAAIKVDEVQLTLRLFDHMEEDGDIVSINFNGVWILDNYLLTRKPKNLYVRMNPQGHNYLILHANNVGSRPPNTVAIEYNFRGEIKRIILNSDMDQSEMVELTLNQPGQ